MTTFSCSVKVDSVKDEDFGALATVSYVDGGGIDIVPSTFELQITEDAAEIVKPGAVLTLSLSS